MKNDSPVALSNNGMHPTADTLLVIKCNLVGRAGDAGRWAARVAEVLRMGAYET
jgi:hypothetical protein